MRKGALAVAAISFALSIGCSSSDGKATSDTQQACDSFQGKLSQCGLASTQGCGALSTCLLNCAANATCTQLQEKPPTGSYLNCQAACQGIGADPFVCASGEEFIDKRGRCDGRPQCPDGSDEVGCGNGSGGAGGGGGANAGGGGSSGGGVSGGGASADAG